MNPGKIVSTLSLTMLVIVLIIILSLFLRIAGVFVYGGLLDLVLGIGTLIFATIYHKRVSGLWTLLALIITIGVSYFFVMILISLSAWKG